MTSLNIPVQDDLEDRFAKMRLTPSQSKVMQNLVNSKNSIGASAKPHKKSRKSSSQGLRTFLSAKLYKSSPKSSSHAQSELVEGLAYVVAGLTLNACESHTIYLHDRGSTSRWQPLSLSTHEFDVATFVIYVGEVHKSTHQKSQWIFVADGSGSLSDDLLAISFRSPSVNCDSVIPINHNLVYATGLSNAPKSCARLCELHLVFDVPLAS